MFTAMLLGTLTTQLYATVMLFASTVVGGSASTCALMKSTKLGDPGFDVLFGNAPFKGDESTLYSLLNESFFYTLHSTSYTGGYITIPAFNVTVPDSDEPVKRQIYPQLPEVTVSNFSALYQGVFSAPTTGDYTFQIESASDAAAMYIFDNQDMYCCEDMNFLKWFPRSTKVINIPTDPRHTETSQTVHLVGGFDYLIVFQAINFSGDAIFIPTITLPSGEKINNFKDCVHIAFVKTYCDIGNSTASIISEGTDPHTTTYSTFYSTKISDGPAVGLSYTEVDTVYYILTPAADPSTSSAAPLSSSTVELSSSSVPSSSSVVVPSLSSSMGTSSSPSELSSTFSMLSSSTDSSAISSAVIISSTIVESSSSELSSSVTSQSASTSSSNSEKSRFTISSTLHTSSVGVTTESITGMLSSTSNLLSSSSTEIVSDVTTALTSSGSGMFVNSTTAVDTTTLVSRVESTHTTSSIVLLTSLYSTLISGNSTTTNTESESVSFSTSTYIDEVGVTRTVVVECSNNDQNSDKSGAETKTGGNSKETSTTNQDRPVASSIALDRDQTRASNDSLGSHTKSLHKTVSESSNQLSQVTVEVVSEPAASSSPSPTVSVQAESNGSSKAAIWSCFLIAPVAFSLLL